MLSSLLISVSRDGSNSPSSFLEHYLDGLLPEESNLTFTHTAQHLLVQFLLPMVSVNMLMVSQTSLEKKPISQLNIWLMSVVSSSLLSSVDITS